MGFSRRTRAGERESAEDTGVNPSANATIGDVIAARFARRDLLKGALGVTAIAATAGTMAWLRADPAVAQAASRFAFSELAAGADPDHHVAQGYAADVLIRWGDPVLADAPAFDPRRQSAAAQKMQFGYNNDFLGYFPMPGAANPSRHGLLVVNHEYTNEELMFPGLGRQDLKEVGFAGMTEQLVGVEMAAHGGSVIEVRRGEDRWSVVVDSRYARRIDLDTPMQIDGPAAGHARMRTAADPSGRRVRGMINNCAGGVTPWGTWLTCEENINYYFSGTMAQTAAEFRNHQRLRIPANGYAWGRYHDRFDIGKVPNEANRFGWVVEIDPFDPAAMPRKRTALGRFKHEGAAGIINSDGRYVIFSGDDERFEYVYRFVTRARVDLTNPRANRDILDDGTLAVARYNTDGTLDWLALVHGEGPLTPANGFASQADVVIEARRAADLLGATKMDRPEDIEASTATRKVYVVLTNNNRRTAQQVDAANPRADNNFGHIIEMIPPDGDNAAARYTWNILVRCGDPAVAAVGATFNPQTSRDGWFGMPDNLAFDHQGRLWIATDGNSAGRTGRTDGLWAMETEGAARATSKHFYRVPVGAEMCGPVFTPDDETLFVAVQHPGEAGAAGPDAGAATYENPATRWPDFHPDMPPRPSVVAITRRGGGRIAS
ncbi:MAG: PhoX family phosphatase [Proteobacteria bacterium]|nr:PhoX family phosphatase [Pseudomonadota bacterium]